MTIVKEFDNVQDAIRAANTLYQKGAADEDVFVIAHDNDTMDAVAHNSPVNKVGIDDMGLETTIRNMYRSRGEALRAKMEEIGLSAAEAQKYEEHLDQGKILLVSKNDQIVL